MKSAISFVNDMFSSGVRESNNIQLSDTSESKLSAAINAKEETPCYLFLKQLNGNEFSDESEGSMFEELCKLNYKKFLYCTGLYIPLDFQSASWFDKIQFVWALLLRGMLLFSNLFIAFVSVSYFNEHFHLALKFLFALCLVTIALQSFVLIPTFYNVSSKLANKCRVVDLKIYEETDYQCIGVFWISFASGLLLPIHFILTADNTIAEHIFYIIIAVLGEFAISIFLVTTIQLIVVDCRVACALLDMMKRKFLDGNLEIELFEKVRDDIKRRVDESYWMSNSVVLVAIFEIVTLVLILLCASVMTNAEEDDDGGGSHHPFNVTFVVFMATFFVKELPFLLLVLWHAAKVNAKSDRLIKLMGVSWRNKRRDIYLQDTEKWCFCCDVRGKKFDAKDTEMGDDEHLLKSAADQEVLRQALYINAEADRISMPLAFMRLKRRDIYVRFSLWVVSLLIGIIKAIIDLHVKGVTR